MTESTRRGARPLLAVLLATYLVILVWLVLWKLHAPYISSSGTGTIKLVPFVSTASAGSSATSEVMGNVLVFVPFGVYLGLLSPPRTWWRALCAIAATSITLEIAQFVLGVGVTDISDVIANTGGGIIGLALVAVFGRGRAASSALRAVCVVATAAALIALVIYIGAPAPHPLRLM